MSEHLKPIIEALIFASPEPLPLKTLCKLLEGEPREDVEAALALLRQDYDRPGGLQLVEVAGGYQICTKPELHEHVRRLFHERTTQKLSVKALETLAVIAYKQPVTAAEIAEIRGVNTSGVLNTLIERKLVKIVGRKQVVGRPFMYATTREFLDKFGLNDLSDLPKVEDLADVLGFDPPSLGDSGPVEMPMTFDFDEEGLLRQGVAQGEAPVEHAPEADDAPAGDALADAAEADEAEDAVDDDDDDDAVDDDEFDDEDDDEDDGADDEEPATDDSFDSAEAAEDADDIEDADALDAADIDPADIDADQITVPASRSDDDDEPTH